jgi:NADH-quinone oxidoreductase subunit K
VIPLSWLLIFSAALFSIGLYGVMSRKNAVAILMGVELMMNAANVNILAFWRYLYPAQIDGLIFIIIVFTTAAAEAAVGMALIISVYRRRKTVVAEEINMLKG